MDSEGLYTLRWIIDNRWGSEEEQEEARAIVTELLGDGGTVQTEPEEETNDPDTGKKVAIVVGHNKYTGASAIDGSDEWIWNKVIANNLKDELAKLGISSEIFIRDSSKGYSSAMRKHADNIGAYGADAAIELHFNSYNETANGTEAIISGSTGATEAAKCVLREWAKEFPKLRLRHDSGIKVDASGRGSGFNNKVPCPSMVWEPIFASNPNEWADYKDERGRMAKAIAKGYAAFLK